jgi:hypothetical protein
MLIVIDNQHEPVIIATNLGDLTYQMSVMCIPDQMHACSYMLNFIEILAFWFELHD